MKLVEIKDLRPGQVWEEHRNLFVVGHYNGVFFFTTMYERGVSQIIGYKNINDFKKAKLIGKLGITHIVKDYGSHMTIEEIARNELPQVDDVVKFNWNDPRLYVINREIDFGIKEKHPNNSCFEATNDLYGSRELVDFELKRVGILGVTHEFINSTEAENV